MRVLENISLRPFNTFHIDVVSKYFSVFNEADGLTELLLRYSSSPILPLGGGSNILFTKNFNGIILKNEVMGIELLREDAHYIYVRAGAGEVWHHFVQYCLQRNWAGVENLSLIPGNVGATPMQNIGAYGVEIKEIFYELEAWSLEDGKVYSFSVNDCDFGYRDSVFKRRFKGRFVILNVVYRLNKIPRFNIAYGAIRE